jgi:hypothetical protein
LWHYRSPDERIKIREKSEQDEMWKETSKLQRIRKGLAHKDVLGTSSRGLSRREVGGVMVA